MSTEKEVVELLRAEEQRLASQYPENDIRSYRVLTSKALILAPEGFFTRFDNAIQHGIKSVRTSGAKTQQDVFNAILSYVHELDTTETSKKVVAHLMLTTLFGYDILDTLMHEKSLQEIHVSPDGAVSISIHGAQRPVSSIQFRDAKHISTVVNKMLKKASSKKKVQSNVIRAVLSQGTTLEVTQHDTGFAFSVFKTVQKRKAPEASLPSIPQSAPEATEPASGRSRSTKQRKAPRSKQGASERTTAPPESSEGPWKVDPKTGKKYKQLPGMDPTVVRDVRKNGGTWMSIEEMQDTVAQDPDFDGDDLNKSAEIFMAHLRVPPDKAEQARLRQEKKERIQKLKKENPEEWGLVSE